MWLILGIFTYLAIGYIFVCLAGANEDGFWDQIKIMLFWPMLWIMLVICYIVFSYIEIRNRIKKKKYEKIETLVEAIVLQTRLGIRI